MKGSEATGRQSEWYRYVIGAMIAAACAAAALLSSGCANDRTSLGASAEGSALPPSDGVLAAANASPVADVPIPAGFRLQDRKSWARRAGTIRYVHHVYRGGDATQDVARFYLDEMATGAWRLASYREADGEFAILFESASEYCFIKITKSWFFGVYKYISVEISPKPQGEFKPRYAASVKPKSGPLE
jgi:hypothetical protein